MIPRLISRFTGPNGRRILLDILKDQKMVAGNIALAERIASCGQLIEVAAGTEIIEQGESDNDLFLILTGLFDISEICASIGEAVDIADRARRVAVA